MAASVLLQAVFAALGPFLREAFTLSRAQVGGLTTAMYLTGSTLSPVAGRIVDRFGTAVPLASLVGIEVLAGAAVAAAPSYGALLAVALLGGCGVSLGNPVTNLLVARYAARGRQGLVTGVKQSGVQLAIFACGMALPSIAAAAGWRAAAAAGLVLPVAAGVTAAVAVPRDPTSRRPGPSGGDASTAAHATTGRRTVRARSGRAALPRATWWLTAYAAGMGIGISALGAHLPLFGVERLGLGATTAGALGAVVGGVGVAARIAWGYAADRRVREAAGTLALLALLATVAAGLVATSVRLGAALVWGGAVLAGATGAAWNAVGMLAIVRGTPVAVAGRASGVVVLSFYGGFVVGPTGFGLVVDALGYAAGWALVGVAFATSLGVALLWRRERPEATAVAPV